MSFSSLSLSFANPYPDGFHRRGRLAVVALPSYERPDPFVVFPERCCQKADGCCMYDGVHVPVCFKGGRCTDSNCCEPPSR